MKLSFYFLSALLILINTTAHADVTDQYKQTCTNNSNASSGAQQDGYCAQANSALTGYKAENAKSVIFSAVSVVTAGLTLVPEMGTVCTALGIGAGASGAAIDSSTNQSIGQSVSTYGSSVAAYPAVTSGLTKVLGSNTMAASKTNSTKACAPVAFLTGKMAISSINSAGADKKIVDSTLDTANSLKNQNNTTIAANNNTGDAGSGTNGATLSSTSTACDSTSGNAYLTCLSPETAALASNPDFVKNMEAALGGKSLGDFAKGYNGDPAGLAAYIANALGLDDKGTAEVSKILDEQKKLAKEGTADTAPTLASKNASVSLDDAFDYNQMMANMLKKMNPDASTEEKKDPSELVFRQLELLSADQLEQRSDISLFLRVGFRYHKTIPLLGNLVWLSPKNQSANDVGRAPASATNTP